jgi:hypothetical protein
LPVTSVVIDNVAGTLRVAGGVASIVADTFAVTGVVASIVIGARLVIFKIFGTCCSVDVLVVVVVSSSVEGVYSENSTLSRRVFIFVRGGIGGLEGKERLERSSLFNHSLKSSLNSC